MKSESWAKISTERSDFTFCKRFQSLKLCIRCIRLYITHLLVKANSFSINSYSCVAVMGSGDILSFMKDVKYRGLDGRLLDFQ
jgi:hypothetical protein